LIIWKLPEYPQSAPRNASKLSSSTGGVGSASPMKREERDSTVGDDYQFEASTPYLITRWQVVGDSDNTRMGAVDWGKDEIKGKVLVAA
jgi:hypothetical protein